MIYKQLEPFYFDKYVNKQLEKILFLFENIHPNYITIGGILINLLAVYLYHSLKSKYFTSLLLIIRVITDSLDGMVARKYEKTSQLGGILDTTADSILAGTLIFGILDYFKVKYCYNLFVSFCSILIILGYLFWYDAISYHKNLTKNDRLINIIPFLIYNNTYIIICFVVILILLFV